MDTKTSIIIASLCVFFWPLFLVVLLAGDKEGAKFWINQSLVITIAAVIVSALGSVIGFLGGIPVLGIIISIVGGLAIAAAGVAIFVFSILGVVSAVQGVEKPLPLIGNIQIYK